MYGLTHSVEHYAPSDYSDMLTTVQFDCAVMTNLEDYVYERNIEEDYKSSEPLFYRSFLEPLGKWLVRLHRKMRIALQVAEERNITSLHNPSTNESVGIGGAYFHAVEHLLILAADITSDVSPVEVMWEIYSWLNENKAKNPNSVPYMLDVKFWPKMTPEVTLAIMDGSAPTKEKTAGISEDENLSTIIDSYSELYGEAGLTWDDNDSDTGIEARVLPEDSQHPLASGGDCTEDQEMLARSGSSSSLSASTAYFITPSNVTNTNSRIAFSSAICDNE